MMKNDGWWGWSAEVVLGSGDRLVGWVLGRPGEGAKWLFLLAGRAGRLSFGPTSLPCLVARPPYGGGPTRPTGKA